MKRQRLHILAAALILGLAAPATAAMNTPKGDWAVGPINAASSSGVGYCSMKNDYRDGTSLVFARDAEGSNSLAIDFHKKVLQTGGQYTLILSVGAIERQMVAIAATPTVLIVQMGLDRDFYNTLQKKKELIVDFQTSQMSFALDGTKDGLAALTACAQAVGSRKSYAQTRVAARPAGSASEASAIEPAAGAAPVLPQPAFNSQGQFTGQLSGTNESPQMETVGSQALAATLQDQVAALKNENRKLLLENQRIAETLQGPPVAAAPVPEVTPILEARPLLPAPSATSAQDLTAALTAAQAGIQQALEVSQAADEEARRRAALEAENAQLRASLDAARAQAEEARRQAAIAAENARLRAELAAAQQEKQRAIEAAQARAASAEAQRQAAIAAENARLKAGLEAARIEKERALAEAAARVEQARKTAAAQAELSRQQAADAAENERRKAALALATAKAREQAPKAAETPAPALQSASATASPPHKSLQIVAPQDDFLGRLLANSHIQVNPDPRNPSGYSWQAGGLVGAAQARDMGGQSLSGLADAYVKRAAERCRGDFAHTIGKIKETGSAQILESELACMNGYNDSAAAVLFVAKDGKLSILSSEGPPSRMEKALSDRDAIISAISQ